MNLPLGGCEYGVVCRMHGGTVRAHVNKRERTRVEREIEKAIARAVRRRLADQPVQHWWSP